MTNWYPEYCLTLDTAEQHVDQIADKNNLILKERRHNRQAGYPSEQIYENEKYELVICIFATNLHGTQSCYAFKILELKRKIDGVGVGMPYKESKGGSSVIKQYTKKREVFSSDVDEAMKNLERIAIKMENA